MTIIIKTSSSIGELSRSSRYISHLKSISGLIESSSFSDDIIGEDDPEYKLILDSNRLLQDIYEEVVATFRFKLLLLLLL